MKTPSSRSMEAIAGVLLLYGGAVVAGRADYSATLLSQGPAAYWRLSETTAPVSPILATNLGTLGPVGNGTYLTDYEPIYSRPTPGALAGSTNSAVRFLGNNGGVYIPYQSAFNTSNSFTVECWVKTDKLTDTEFVPTPISSIFIGSTARNGWLMYLITNAATGDNRWQFRLGNSSGYIYDSSLSASPSVVTGRWYHLTGVFSSGNGNTSFYVNGALVDTHKASGTYVPNLAQLLTIGTRSDLPFSANGAYASFYGAVDEVAFYPSALSASRILAHYQNGTNASPSQTYSSLVMADGASGYWRLDQPPDPPLPTATNLGTLGASANGAYQYPSTLGVPGPRPPTFTGFETTNTASGFNALYAVVRVPPLQLNTNEVTITCWVKRSGDQVGDAGIAFVYGGSTLAGLQCDPGGNNELSYYWSSNPATENYRSYLTLPDSQWAFAALAVHADRAEFYLYDGANFAGATNHTAHAVLPFDGGLTIGADYPFPPYNNLGFVGEVDEVAIFKRGLSIGEIYTQYAAGVGGVAPRIFAEPQSPTNILYAGDSFTLSADVGGSPALSYQWRRNSVDIPGATTPVFTKTGAGLGDSGSYDLVVTNASGMAFSIAVDVTINPADALPGIAQDPQGRTVYAGGTWAFDVEALGGALGYQWQRNEINIPGANASRYMLAPVASTNAGDYRVIITNSAGAVTSAVATLTVLIPAAGYETAVIADGAESWYRLDETSGSTMYDALGRHDGAYFGSYTLGTGGTLKDNTNTCVTFDGLSAYGEVPYTPGLNANVFSVEAWVRPTSTDFDQCAVASFSQPPGRGYLLYQATTNWWLAWGDGTDSSIYYLEGGPVQAGQWQHLVATYDGSLYLFYVNGELKYGDFVTLEPATNAAFHIGVDEPLSLAWRDFWEGQIDEVAYYRKALTGQQIANHYEQAIYGSSTAPFFTMRPQSDVVAAGSTETFTAVVKGTTPLRYQWARDGNPIPGATNAALTLTNVDYSDAAHYQLGVTNAAGSTNSPSVALQVYPAASFCNLTNQLVLHLSFDGEFTDTSGRGHDGTPVGTPFFVSGILSGAVHVSTDPTISNTNYVTLGTPADLKFGSNTDFSISCWVRFNGNPADLPFYGDSTNSYGAPGVTIAPSYQNGGWSFSLVDNGENSVRRIGPGNSINDGNWHNLVLTCARSGNVNWYVDGVRVAQHSASGLGDLSTPYPVNVGQDGTGSYSYAGQLDIDDLCVWQRVLTYYEAQAINGVARTYGESVDAIGPVTLTLRLHGAMGELIWQAGTLVEASSLNGPWTPVLGAQAPFHSIPLTGEARFYRVEF